MKILITGNLGFIFSNFTEYLLDKYNYEIIGYDALTYAAHRELPDIWKEKYGDRFSQYYGRIEDLRTLLGLCKRLKPDLILQAAAQSHVDRSIESSYPFIETNIKGTWSVLEVARIQKIPTVFMSTDEVLYHKKPAMPGGPICNPEIVFKGYDWYGWKGFYRCKENEKLNPRNPYAASKAAAEHLINSYIETHKIDAKIVRCTNVFGPRQNKEKFLSKAIFNLIEDKPVPVYGEGAQWRDWLYVKDFCAAFDLIMHKGTEPIYHIAANDERQNIETINLVCNFMDKYPEQYIKFVEDRPGHDYSYSLNCDKLKMLGWKPQYSFGQGLEETINYYRSQYEKVVS